VGAAAVLGAHTVLKGRLRLWAVGGLFLLGTLLIFGSIYFAPQALFPFLFFGVASSAALWFWTRAMFRRAVLAALLLIPLGVFCFYGASHMVLLTRFRGLESRSVQEIKLVQTGTDKTVLIEGTNACNQILHALAATTPYSPNHEGIRDSWVMTMVLVNGSTIRCRVGKGNSAHPETAWVEVHGNDYQNAELMQVLQRLEPGLWPVAARQPGGSPP
jgi:hypothetical protein